MLELPVISEDLPWTQDLELSVQHLKIVALLHAHGADINFHIRPHMLTPLMSAAAVGNAAVVDMLCRLGADTEIWCVTDAEHERCCWWAY